MTDLSIKSISIIHDGFTFVYTINPQQMEEAYWVGRCYEDAGPQVTYSISRNQMKEILAEQ